MAQPFGCRVCGAIVPQTISKTNANRKYQRQFCSQQCKKLHLKSYLSKWGAENISKVREYKASKRDQVREWNRQFYARHKERRKKLRVERYNANPEKELARIKDYAKKHPELIRVIGRKSRSSRRARVMQAFVEMVHPTVVFQRDKGVCGICGKPVELNGRWDVDHVIPLSKGGAHSYSNVQLAHMRCNRSKGANVPEATGR